MLVRQKVVRVIGMARARVELGKVGEYEVNEPLIKSFPWFETPQGQSFWQSINSGKSPYLDNDYNYLQGVL